MVTGAYQHPRICGHEISGVVLHPAPDSARFQGGERVAVFPQVPCGRCRACEGGEPFHCATYDFLGSRRDGGFAGLCLAPEENLFPLPAGCDPRVGSFVEPLAVSLHVVRRSGFAAGQDAVVIGAGALGILVCRWLSVLGASRVTLIGRSPQSLQTARAAGVEEVVSTTEKDRHDLREFDLGFDATGSGPVLQDLFVRVRPGGTITVFGRDKEELRLPPADFERFLRKEILLRGAWGYNGPRDAPEIRRVLEQGAIDVLPLITKEVPLSRGAEAIRSLFLRREYACRTLITTAEPA
jgi:L-iditol 2-dehydrogenase